MSTDCFIEKRVEDKTLDPGSLQPQEEDLGIEN